MSCNIQHYFTNSRLMKFLFFSIFLINLEYTFHGPGQQIMCFAASVCLKFQQIRYKKIAIFFTHSLPLIYRISTPYWIRTSDQRLRRPLLYPTELRAHNILLNRKLFKKYCNTWFTVYVFRFMLPVSVMLVKKILSDNELIIFFCAI